MNTCVDVVNFYGCTKTSCKALFEEEEKGSEKEGWADISE